MGILQQNPQILTSDSFPTHLQDVATRIESVLDATLPPPTTRLHEAMRYSVLGPGKRLRSFLVWESCKLFNVSNHTALQVAAAVEMIQAYSLVHDDLPCMDNADLRRGKPSCHKMFGEATATLTGDALIPLAYQLLASIDASPEIRVRLIESLSYTIGSEGLVAGQMKDLGQEASSQTEEDLRELQRQKTGVFFAFACEAGAILGQASLQEHNALKTYGFLFGQVFQMVDDYLDGCGQEETLGKPVRQDTQKLTFLTLLGPDLLRKKAEALVKEAIDVLDVFQGRTSFLKDAIHASLTRTW